MVNTGKPSRGCYMCRARRIKCDEGKPSCMRCQKSKRVCPGYRDVFELKLRDETKSTRRKLSTPAFLSVYNYPPFAQNFDDASSHQYDNAGALVTTCPPGPPPVWQETNWIDDENYHWGEAIGNTANDLHPSNSAGYDSPRSLMSLSNILMDRPSLCKQPAPTTIDQRAVCFFLSNYVMVPDNNSLTSRGHLDWVVPMLKTHPRDSPLALTFTSAGLATMAVRHNSYELLPMARSMYVKCLKQVNGLLQDARTATSDTTLATICLLIVFEQVVSTENNMAAWTSHVHGALAIVKARSKKSFSTPLGKALFVAVREIMTIHYIARAAAPSPSVDWWINAIETGEDPELEKYISFNLRIAALRQENDRTTSLSPKTHENASAVHSLLTKARKLEKEYGDWYSTMPPSYRPEMMAWLGWDDVGLQPGADLSESIAHPGRIDNYNELGLSYASNTYRASRMLIWSTILRCVAWLGAPGDYRLTDEHRQAKQICEQLIEDIVASVPYFFGWNAETDPMSSTKKSQDAKGVSGVFLMFPLWVASRSDFVNASQRSYLSGRLQFIGSDMGITQARILSNANIQHPSLYIMHELKNLEKTNLEVNPHSNPAITPMKHLDKASTSCSPLPTFQGSCCEASPTTDMVQKNSHEPKAMAGMV